MITVLKQLIRRIEPYLLFSVDPALIRAVCRVAILILITIALVIPTGTTAAINQQINYQGKLTDASNAAVTDADYSIVFSLYTVSSGGSNVWTETKTVTVTNGLFSVMLGSGTSLATVDFNQTLYLGVKVGSDSEMTPRKIIGAVPAAFEADKLDGLDSLSFVNAATTTLPNVWSMTGLGQIGSSSATTTALGNLSVIGTTIFNGLVSGYQQISAPFFTATSSQASTFPYASSTAITSVISYATNFFATGSSTLQNFTAVNSTTTNATTTTLFSTTASSTNLFTSNFTLGRVSGFLKATAGAVTTSLIDLTADITGVLGISNGGTNQTAFSNGAMTYFDGTRLNSTSSPTIGWLTATTSNATSTFVGNVNIIGNLQTSASSTATGQAIFTYVPILPHSFSSWVIGAANTNVQNSTLFINPTTAVTDTNLLGLAVGNSAKFIVDAEGDVFANSLTLVGSQTVSTSSISTLIVENNSFLGDAANSDWTHIKGSAWIEADKSSGASSTALTVTQTGSGNIFRIASDYSTANPFFLVTAAGNVGIGTSSPYAPLSVLGQVVASYFTATTSQASTFPYASTTGLTVSTLASTTNLLISKIGTSTQAFAVGSGSITNIDMSGGDLYVGGDGEIDGVLYVQGQLISSGETTFTGGTTFTHVPTQAHSFSSWSIGAASSNVDDATIYINPASAAADTNLLGAAIGGSVKFLLDAEGDIFANSITTIGGSTLSTSTISTLVVENSSYLGDAASNDWTHIKGSAWVESDKSSGASSTAFSITQTGTGDFLRVATDYAGAIAKFVIKNSGLVGVGTSSPFAKFSIHANNGETDTSLFEVGSSTASATSTLFKITNAGYVGIGTVSPIGELNVVQSGVTNGNRGISNIQYSDTAHSGVISIGKSRGTVAAPTTVADGDFLGRLQFSGYGSSAFSNTTFIDGKVNGTVSGNTIPTDMIFSTNSTERLRILNGGNIGVASSSPWGLLSVNANALSAGVPQFVVGSSTATNFIVANNGNVGIGITDPSTLLYVRGISPTTTLRDSVTGITGNLYNVGALNFEGSDASSNVAGAYASIEAYAVDENSNAQGTVNEGGRLDFNIWRHDASAVARTKYTALSINNFGAVGIGTTTPFATLAVNPLAGFASNQFVVGSSTATSLIIKNNGNVGINNTTANQKLDVNGIIQAYNGDGLADPTAAASAGARFSFNSGTGASNFYGMGIGAIDGTQYPIWFQTGSTNGGGFEWYIGASEQARIHKDGNFGIGTTSPYAKLSVVGPVVAAYFHATSTAATSTFDTNIQSGGNTGFRVWANTPGATWASGSVTIGGTFPDNGFSVTRVGGSDSTFARFRTSASGDFIQILSSGAGVVMQGRNSSTATWQLATTNGHNYFAPTAGDFGFGVSSPTARMQIATSTTASSTTKWSNSSTGSTATDGLEVGIGADGNNWIWGMDATPIKIGTANVERLTITSGGGVGIGTTSPASTLSVTGSIYSTGGLGLGGMVAQASNTIYFGTSGGVIGPYLSRDSSTGGLIVDNHGGAGGGFVVKANAGATTVATFKNTGLVGIGTTTPNWNLQVAGTRPSFAITDTAGGTNKQHWLFSSQGGNFYVATSSDILATSTISALTVNSNGWLGIGTTSPSAKLAVAGGIFATASSTFMNGIDLTNGCFSIRGTCFASGGSGTVNTGTINSLTYYPGTGTTVDDASGLLWLSTNSSLIIATSTTNAGLYTNHINRGFDGIVSNDGDPGDNLYVSYGGDGSGAGDNDGGTGGTVYIAGGGLGDDDGNGGNAGRVILVSGGAPDVGIGSYGSDGRVDIGNPTTNGTGAVLNVYGNASTTANLFVLGGYINSAASYAGKATSLDTSISLADNGISSSKNGGTGGSVSLGLGGTGYTNNSPGNGGVGGTLNFAIGGTGGDIDTSGTGGTGGAGGTLNIAGGGTGGQGDTDGTGGTGGTLNLVFGGTGGTTGADGTVNIGRTGGNENATLQVNGKINLQQAAASGVGDTFLCLDSTGDIQSGATCAASTEKVKTNIQKYTGGLTSILGLSAISFNYDLNYYDGREDISFSAEKTAEIDRRFAVIAEKDEILLNGKLVKKGDPIALNTNAILAATVSAIQEQQLQIASTTEKLDQLIAGGKIATNYWTMDSASSSIKTFAAVDMAGFEIRNVKAITSASGKWSIDENGKLLTQDIETKRLLVEEGVTTKDKSSGDYYCIYVEGGSVKTDKGRCEDLNNGVQGDESDDSNSEPEPEPEPEPEVTPEPGVEVEPEPELVPPTAGPEVVEPTPEPEVEPAPEPPAEENPPAPEESSAPEPAP